MERHQRRGSRAGLSAKERFIVLRVLRIGSGKKERASRSEQDPREYEVKLSKKWLILQPLGGQTLSVCEKIDLEHIKDFDLHRTRDEVVLNYGGCTLALKFMTRNLELFRKQLSKHL